ncbi:MAG TPA: caspase family protein, partial [Rhizobiales bacterium]|nr:caspase family protein [Hyphomicrobiales bacterium]
MGFWAEGGKNAGAGATATPGVRLLSLFSVFIALVFVAAPPAHAGIKSLGSEAEMQKVLSERWQSLDELKAQLEALPAVQAAGSGTGKRRALVIGNDAYEALAPLQKAVADADSVAKTLSGLGFEVTSADNLARDPFDETLEAFYESLEEHDVALIFYSGHGLAMEGSNYLLPVDMPMLEPDEGPKLRREAVNAGEILARLGERGVGLALVVLDACRDDPFARDGTRGGMSLKGLARMEPQKGMFVLYSAGVGQKALDRLGPDDGEPNSVFTRKFMPILATPGLPLVDIAKRTQVEVQALARKVHHTQEPAYYDQVVGQYYFQPPKPRLFGIAIGIDDYAGYKLAGAVNDADVIADAVRALGAEKVVALKDADARLLFIEYVWNDMLAEARPGDTIVLSYSGVSGQRPAPAGAGEEDGKDEFVVLSGGNVLDARGDPASVAPDAVLSDDDLTRWMEAAADRNVNVVLLVDGCHGGGLLDRPFANVSFLGASAEDELVLEYEVEGRKHGLASVAFAYGIGGYADYNGDGYVTQRELFVYVDRQVLNIAGLEQTPQFLPALGVDAGDMPLFRLA